MEILQDKYLSVDMPHLNFAWKDKQEFFQMTLCRTQSTVEDSYEQKHLWAGLPSGMQLLHQDYNNLRGVSQQPLCC